MALRDEIQQILDEGLALHPLAKLAAEGGEDAIRDKVMETDPTVGLIEIANLHTGVIAAHADALMRLADEIDALKAERK